jgi:hypothetical protein
LFENRVLRRIFGPKRDEVTGEWRKLHNKELHNLLSIIRMIKPRKMRWIGHVARMGEKRDAYVLVVKPKGTRPLGRPRRRWADAVTTNLGVFRTGNLESSCEGGKEPSGLIKYREVVEGRPLE